MRVGIFLPNWIGDVVMATPALRAVREYFGQQARILGVMRPYVKQVLAGTTWLDEQLVYNRHSIAGIAGLVRQLRQQQLDAVLLLTNSLSTSVFAWWAGVPQRIGFALHGRRLLLTHPLWPHRNGRNLVPYSAVDHYLDVVRVLGCTPRSQTPELATTAADEAAVTRLWEHFGWNRQHAVAVLNTGGAYGAAKTWPDEHFSKLARWLVDQHGMRVLFLCGPAEQKTVASICQHANHAHIKCLAGQKLGIGLSKACVRRGTVMVTTDSGPRHFAAAFGVPTVTLFGPTDPRWSDNYLDESIDLQLDVDCGPCGKRVCPLQHHGCMRDLSVNQVAAATATLMETALSDRAA